MATGEYIWFFSDDDLPMDGCLNELHRIIGEHMQSVAFYLNWIYFKKSNNGNQIVNEFGNGFKLNRDISVNKNELLRFSPHNLTFMSSNIVRRNVLSRENAIWPYSRSQFPHFEITLKAIKTDERIVVLKRPMIMARLNNESYLVDDIIWKGLSQMYRELEIAGFDRKTLNYVKRKIAWEISKGSFKMNLKNHILVKKRIDILRIFFPEYRFARVLSNIFYKIPNFIIALLAKVHDKYKNIKKDK